MRACPIRVGRPSSVKKLSDSKPNAAPDNAHTSSSIVSASIAPLTPPAGNMLPSSAARASVVGAPFLSIAQPSGIGLPVSLSRTTPRIGREAMAT